VSEEIAHYMHIAYCIQYLTAHRGINILLIVLFREQNTLYIPNGPNYFNIPLLPLLRWNVFIIPKQTVVFPNYITVASSFSGKLMVCCLTKLSVGQCKGEKYNNTFKSCCVFSFLIIKMKLKETKTFKKFHNWIKRSCPCWHVYKVYYTANF